MLTFATEGFDPALLREFWTTDPAVCDTGEPEAEDFFALASLELFNGLEACFCALAEIEAVALWDFFVIWAATSLL